MDPGPLDVRSPFEVDERIPVSHRRAAIALVFLTWLGLPQAAETASGPPLPLEDVGGQGVAAADGTFRYVTLRRGLRDGYETTLLKVTQEGGKVERSRIIDDDFSVPAVAMDGTPTGLSHDGSTLALIKPRATFFKKTTEIMVLETERMTGEPGRITLDGDFSLDGLSPDGETLYLIEHTDRRDPGAYQVRAYDIDAQQLDPDPILDAEEEPGEMRGQPQTRATSADGRWEYTLYDGGEHPFIHALDVANAATVCIDLDMIHARNTYGAELTVNDIGEVELTDRRGELRAVVNPESFEATEPSESAEEANATVPDEGSGLGTGLIAGGVALLGLGGILLLRRRE